jgi:Leucine-rich repeat (LRR) protein
LFSTPEYILLEKGVVPSKIEFGNSMKKQFYNLLSCLYNVLINTGIIHCDLKPQNMIMLDNCVASIPDSVCNLPKLKFLALINNKQLKSIPECVSSLPALLFLNLKGSPNVEVPQAIREKGTDMGGGMWDLQD